MKIFKRDIPADISLAASLQTIDNGSRTGSHLPINFPSVVLVSGCPITSNNGHPRAIYRVCVRHECLQTWEREILEAQHARDSGATYTFSTLIPQPWPLRFAQLDIADPSTKRGGVEDSRKRRSGERVRVHIPVLPPLWRISDVRLSRKKKKKKKKEVPTRNTMHFRRLRKTTLQEPKLSLFNHPLMVPSTVSKYHPNDWFVERGHGRVSKYTKYELSGSD